MAFDRSDEQLAHVDGKLHHFTKLSDLPRDIAVEIGRELGISPVCYLGSSADSSSVTVWDHLEVLADSAAVLGYGGATVARLAENLLEQFPFGSAPSVRVALVPDPTSHKASPPGFKWFMHAEPFDPVGDGDRSGPVESLRLAVSDHVRNHRDPSARVLLWDDLGIALSRREASEKDVDAMILMNTESRVASLAAGAVVVADEETLFTPPLGDGAVDTAWRRRMLFSGEVSEASLTLQTVFEADYAFCLTAWGERIEIGSIESNLIGAVEYL